MENQTTGHVRGSATLTRTSRGKPRQRSSIACQRCHARRVKCNAASEIPCSNCQKTNQECRLIDSKRSRKRQRVEGPTTTHIIPSTPVSISPEAQNEETLRQDRDETLDAEHGAAEMSSHLASNEGPESLYAQMLENSTSSDKDRGRRNAQQVMYLGETFNLTHLVHQTHPESRRHVHKHHYALPVKQKRSVEPPGSNNDDDGLLDFLRHQGAFIAPQNEICHQLFRVYFTYFHPHYPILDRREFATHYADPKNPSSHLLLQVVLFTAVGHCDLPLVQAAGFASRYEARLKLFKRAKALYDADYETDKVTIVQSLFLMSFWWNSPTDQKDTWHWLGTAISLGVTLGMHRSTSNSDLSINQQRLWKKIWWSLFAEDKHAAAALGRPVHIHLKDCDVEALTESDFDEGPLPDIEAEKIFGRQQTVHILYVIFLSELSKVVERIIEKSFNAYDQTTSSRIHTLQSCEKLLQDWESRLPPQLQLRNNEDNNNIGHSNGNGIDNALLWTSMLHIAHSWFKILIHRSITLESTPTSHQHHARNNPSTNTATTTLIRTSQHSATGAANQITRLIESLLSSSQITHCPIHIVPAAFAAMGMHAIDVRCGDALREQLGYVKIRLDMLALRELKSTWPVSGWIFLLFTRIVRKIREEGGGEAAAVAGLMGLQDEVEPVAVSLTEEPSQGQNHTPSQHSIAQNSRQSLRPQMNVDVGHYHSPHHVHGTPGTSFGMQDGMPAPPPAIPIHQFQENFSTAWEASNISMPLNFPSTWNDALDESLLYDPGVDFWIGMPQGDGSMY